MLQCVAVCCSLIIVCCRAFNISLHYVAMFCSVVQHVTVCCSVLQSDCNVLQGIRKIVALCCSVLQCAHCVAVPYNLHCQYGQLRAIPHCNTFQQRTTSLTSTLAISCGVLQRIMLQYTATDCNRLQHVAILYRGRHFFDKYVAVCSLCCSALQLALPVRTASRYTALQHISTPTAAHCNTPQNVCCTSSTARCMRIVYIHAHNFMYMYIFISARCMRFVYIHIYIFLYICI